MGRFEIDSQCKQKMKDKACPADDDYGTLFVVSTPIGNLEDITLRALRILKSVEIIAAENMAHAHVLCKHHDIKTRITRYHQHNQKIKTSKLIRQLKSGNDIAIITDAGTPCISDPGLHLINRAIEEEIKTTPIPGPSAVIAALSVSGLPTDGFLFEGFLPNKSGRRKKILSNLIYEPRTIVFFEAPHRIKAMLTDLKDVLGDRQLVMLREMTKIFEEMKKGPISSVLEFLTPDKIRGEFTLVVEGGKTEKVRSLSKETINKVENLLREQIMTVKDIAALLAGEEGLTYRQVYKECLAKKKIFDRIGANGTGSEI